MKKNSISTWLLCLAITMLISGCATAPQTEDKATTGTTSNIRISGDLTVETINRKGF